MKICFVTFCFFALIPSVLAGPSPTYQKQAFAEAAQRIYATRGVLPSFEISWSTALFSDETCNSYDAVNYTAERLLLKAYYAGGEEIDEKLLVEGFCSDRGPLNELYPIAHQIAEPTKNKASSCQKKYGEIVPAPSSVEINLAYAARVHTKTICDGKVTSKVETVTLYGTKERSQM